MQALGGRLEKYVPAARPCQYSWENVRTLGERMYRVIHTFNTNSARKSRREIKGAEISTYRSRNTTLDLLVGIDSLSGSGYDPNGLLNMITNELFGDLYQMRESVVMVLLVCKAQINK